VAIKVFQFALFRFYLIRSSMRYFVERNNQENKYAGSIIFF